MFLLMDAVAALMHAARCFDCVLPRGAGKREVTEERQRVDVGIRIMPT